MIEARIVDLMDDILDETKIAAVPANGSTIEFIFDGAKFTSEVIETYPTLDKENRLIRVEIRVNVKSPVVDED